MRVSQTFCRHKRFIQRCPICRESVPGYKPEQQRTPVKRPHAPHSNGAAGVEAGARAGAGIAGGAGVSVGRASTGRASTRRGAPEVRVLREERSADDGYRCELVQGLRSSGDARRLAQEIGFASGRLLTLTAAPPGLFGEARACEDVEQATWMCFMAAYISPLEGFQPFAGVRQALVHSWASGLLPDLDDVPLGPRTSHDPSRGDETLIAYRRFVEHAGSQERAFDGEPEWTPKRRFERAFERLALPGFGRIGRFDFLIALGRLGLYEMRADSLHLTAVAPRSSSASADPTMLAAKRIFGIADPLLLERRAHTLADALGAPIEALDLALWNWTRLATEERATLGLPHGTVDARTLERAHAALEV
jgi:Alpha-glutamyl/putrescinyl thymine pyrophosphorylase clade 3